MKRAILKYGLRPGMNTISMPMGAVVIAVQTQYEVPSLWALVDPEPDVVKTDRLFVVMLTGQEFEMVYGMVYRGNFQLKSGSFVGHVWEQT